MASLRSCRQRPPGFRRTRRSVDSFPPPHLGRLEPASSRSRTAPGPPGPSMPTTASTAAPRRPWHTETRHLYYNDHGSASRSGRGCPPLPHPPQLALLILLRSSSTAFAQYAWGARPGHRDELILRIVTPGQRHAHRAALRHHGLTSTASPSSTRRESDPPHCPLPPHEHHPPLLIRTILASSAALPALIRKPAAATSQTPSDETPPPVVAPRSVIAPDGLIPNPPRPLGLCRPY